MEGLNVKLRVQKDNAADVIRATTYPEFALIPD